MCKALASVLLTLVRIAEYDADLSFAFQGCLRLQSALHQLCWASQEADSHASAQPCHCLVCNCQLRTCMTFIVIRMRISQAP